MIDLLYTFSTATTAPPTSNQLRCDAADPALVTRLWIRNETTDGIDAARILLSMPAGSVIYVQDKNDHTLATAFELAAPPVDQTTYVEIPVMFTASTGAGLLNNQAVLFLSVPPVAATPVPDIDPTPTPPLPIDLPPLVTLAQAKDHLRVTWVDGDPRDGYLALTLAQAQGAILTRCGRTDYGRTQVLLWTDPGTTPTNVRRAILLKLGELMDHRGDDRATEAAAREAGADESPWIEALLRVYSDPVLA